MFLIFDSFTDIRLQVLMSTIFGIVLCSFGEHAIHRHVMHRRRLSAWLYRAVPELKVLFHNHAVMHHGKYYATFDHEPNPAGKFFNLRITWKDTAHLVLLFTPILIALWFLVSPLPAVILLALLIGQNLAWSAAHVQMHVPDSNRWFHETAYFRFIARHHFMHHQFSTKNYNVVLPIADFILGTTAKPRLRDVREMLRLGYLRPRTEAGRRLYRSQHRADPVVVRIEPIATNTTACADAQGGLS